MAKKRDEIGMQSADCMVHSGYEASAVNDSFSSAGGLVRTAKASLFPF